MGKWTICSIRGSDNVVKQYRSYVENWRITARSMRPITSEQYTAMVRADPFALEDMINIGVVDGATWISSKRPLVMMADPTITGSYDANGSEVEE